jgi:hypothetical protein
VVPIPVDRISLVSALVPLVASALAAPAAQAGVVCVEPGGGPIAGCDLVRPTIAGGIDDAFPGDVIRVAQGNYAEHISIDANVTLEGGWDPTFTHRDPVGNGTTIEAAEDDRSVVQILGSSANPASSTPVIDGFTITGANSLNEHGGGIRMHDSNATVRNCVIIDNQGYLFGGGIWAQRGAPRIEGNRIENNRVTPGGNGGGISLEGSSATLVDNVIVNNRIADGPGHGGGVSAVGPGSVVVRGGRIEFNDPGPGCTGEGGGIYASNLTQIRIEGVRIENNCAMTTGGALLDGAPFVLESSLVIQRNGVERAVTLVDDVSPGAVRNSTFVGTDLGVGFGLVALSEIELTSNIFTGFAIAVETDYDIDPPVSSYNVFWDNVANTDVDWSLGPTDRVVDPLLDATYHLTAGSPAIDTGVRPPNPTRDVDGDPRVADGGSGRFLVDVGADEFEGREQRNVDLAVEAADLEIIGPGNPPENPGSAGSNDWIGRAVLGADVSGDGAADLVCAAQDFADDFDTLNAGGRLFGLLHFGTRRTGTIDLASEAADFEVTSEVELLHLGETLASGDLDDDGLGDLIVGASDTHGAPGLVPAAFVLFGGADLGANGATLTPGSLGDLAVLAPEESSLAFATEGGLAVGDLDDDGVDDLVVGDAVADDGSSADVGAVFVLFGGTGIGGVHDLATTPADFTLYGPQANDTTFAAGPYAGGLALGDLDDDGTLDLVARNDAEAHVLFGPLAAGTQRLASQPADRVLNDLSPGGVLVMDATGDGKDDLLLDSQGFLHVIAGPLTPGPPLDAGAARAFTLHHDDAFAAASLAAADVTGGSRPDLLLGKPEDRAVYVVAPGAHGPGTVAIGDVASAFIASSTVAAARNLGWDVAGGDLDGDGRDDLLIGAWQTEDPSRPDKFRDVGKTFVFYGSVPEPGSGPAALAALVALAAAARVRMFLTTLRRAAGRRAPRSRSRPRPRARGRRSDPRGRRGGTPPPHRAARRSCARSSTRRAARRGRAGRPGAGVARR